MSLRPHRVGLVGVCVLCLALVGPASAGAPPYSSPAPLADWGDPQWTLAVMATPAIDRVSDARMLAQAALADLGAPATLLQPAQFTLSRGIGSGTLQAYACLAGVRGVSRGGRLTASGGIRAAQIDQGADLSGVSPRYLFAVARAESGLSAYARSPTSSAAGLFQFVDQTWLRAVRRYGPGLGLAAEAGGIRIGADGRARVADPQWRAEILALRYDPMVAARLAGALTRENAAVLRAALGRPPTAGELYAAHLLGPRQALLLLSADRVTPAYPARTILPVAAASNRALFYAGAAPRSVRQVVVLIADRASGGGEP